MSNDREIRESDERHAAALSIELDRTDSQDAVRRGHRTINVALGVLTISTIGQTVSVWRDFGMSFPVLVFASLAICSLFALTTNMLEWQPLEWLPVGVRGKRTAPTLPQEQALELLPAAQIVDLVQPFGDPTLVGFPVVPIGGDLYAVARIPNPEETESFGYRDIVTLEARPDGIHVLREVHARSGWGRRDAVLPAEFIVSEELVTFLRDVTDHGGVWMRYSGGCLAVATPPGSTWDFDASLDLATARARLAP